MGSYLGCDPAFATDFNANVGLEVGGFPSEMGAEAERVGLRV